MGFALISGGTSGIGLMIARHLLGEGWQVLCFSMDEGQVKEFSETLGKEHAGKATALVCDITSDDDIAALVSKLKAEGTTPDLVINCAAILGPVGQFHENDFAKWQLAVDIDLTGNARLLHALIPLLLESLPQRQAEGRLLPRVINIGGGGAGYARLYHSAYGAAKTAMVRLTENLALEYKERIAFNIIAPGAYKTNIWKDETHDKEPAQWSDESRLFALIDYLAGPQSEGVTGRFIHIENDYRSFTPAISGTDRFLLRRTN